MYRLQSLVLLALNRNNCGVPLALRLLSLNILGLRGGLLVVDGLRLVLRLRGRRRRHLVAVLGRRRRRVVVVVAVTVVVTALDILSKERPGASDIAKEATSRTG